VQLGGGKALSVALDHGRIYVTTSAGDIVDCDPADCTATAKPMVRDPLLYGVGRYTYDQPVVADDQAIYWAALDVEGPGGPDAGGPPVRIMKLAK